VEQVWRIGGFGAAIWDGDDDADLGATAGIYGMKQIA
jgi:hypothetical protein